MAKTTTKAIGQKGLFVGAAAKGPEGSYSGDKPNPHLRAFVEQHLAEHPYNAPTDKYDVPAFNKPIETTKATALYNMHMYWSKKPHDAIRQYVRHYTKSGDLVLDPFCGSGGTALAALMEGRKAIAIDRSPAAAFITKNYCTPVDPDELREAFEQIKAHVAHEIDWLYETRCDRCAGKATTVYTVHSQVFQCPRCLEKVPLFDCIKSGKDEDDDDRVRLMCPSCHRRGKEEVISVRDEKFGIVPVLVCYICDGGCKPARDQRTHNDANRNKAKVFSDVDVSHLAEIDGRKIPHWYPTDRMMHAPANEERWGLLWRPYLSGRSRVCDFFQKRNLWALAAIRNAVLGAKVEQDIKDALLFAFTSSLLNASDLYRYRDSGKGGISMGTYYVGPMFQVMNAWRAFADKINDLVRGYESMPSLADRAMVSCQSVTSLTGIPSNSIDYLFTDPPYSWKVQYGESNFVWEAWLELDCSWHEEEIIVNDVRGKGMSDWADLMKHAMAECFRVLKPGRWISLCYHDTSEGTWALLQDLMAEVGFVVEGGKSALFIDTGQKSWKQTVADKVNKRDLVINFRKPKPGEFRITRLIIPEHTDVQTFGELARQVIRDCLQAAPGSTKDRVYDELVSHMVRSGQMQAHNFDELLREVAEEAPVPGGGASRWYLRESEEAQLDASEQQAEDRAAAVMEKFIAKNANETYAVGMHYSDLFEHYLYAVKDKPRRSLADWLPDYFFKTEAGTWRLPDSDEERELKKGSRVSGANRRVRRFASMLSAGVSIPQNKLPTSPTLAEWIRHAKRAGLYEAGKLLYERGGIELEKLSEELQVAVEEDYQTCVRALQRAAGADLEPKKRGRRKKADDNE